MASEVDVSDWASNGDPETRSKPWSSPYVQAISQGTRHPGRLPPRSNRTFKPVVWILCVIGYSIYVDIRVLCDVHVTSRSPDDACVR